MLHIVSLTLKSHSFVWLRRRSSCVAVFWQCSHLIHWFLSIPALQATGLQTMKRVFGTGRVPVARWQGRTPSSATSPLKEVTSFSSLFRNCNSKDVTLNNCWSRAAVDTRYGADFGLVPLIVQLVTLYCIDYFDDSAGWLLSEGSAWWKNRNQCSVV